MTESIIIIIIIKTHNFYAAPVVGQYLSLAPRSLHRALLRTFVVVLVVVGVPLFLLSSIRRATRRCLTLTFFSLRFFPTTSTR